jgi:steroid 5-alpha reductase family enzyme
MLGALGVAVLRKRHDGIDAVWGGGFAIVAITTLILSAGAGDAWRRWLITALTVVWGARLAWHIGRRNHGRPEDERYVALMARAGNPHLRAVRRIYLPQAAAMWFVSLPVQLGQYGFATATPGVVTAVIGVALWLVGFLFEAIGDAQLARSPRTRTTRARSWARACGATPATPTTSATRSSGGVSQSSRCTTPPG